MTELKCLLQSVPFRTFAMSPLAAEAMAYQQCVEYDPKYNPIKNHTPSAAPAPAPAPADTARAAVPAYVKSYDSIRTPAPPAHAPTSTTPTSTTPTAAAPILPHPRPSQTPRFPKPYEYDSLTELLIRYLDELSPMYSREWMRDATQQIKQKLVAFLVDPNVVKALGRKKTCDAIYFLELRPKPDEARMKNLGWILSFLLERIVFINEKKHTWNSKAGITDTLQIAHHANGRWSLKN